MRVGDVYAWERTFSVEDVIQFGIISGDQGIHHVERDEQGRLMARGKKRGVDDAHQRHHPPATTIVRQ